jgi:predicted HTH transcriptional regulator
VYSEPDQAVRLVLKNNIVMRTLRQKDRTMESIGSEIWMQLDELEKRILTYMTSRGSASRGELVKYTKKSGSTITRRLNHLMTLEVIEQKGNRNDPNLRYGIKRQVTSSMND